MVIQDIQEITQRGGAIRTTPLDYSPSLAEGDYLAAVPAIAVIQIRGRTPAVASQIALAPGATPSEASFLLDTPREEQEYVLEASARTNGGETIIIPLRVRTT